MEVWNVNGAAHMFQITGEFLFTLLHFNWKNRLWQYSNFRVTCLKRFISRVVVGNWFFFVIRLILIQKTETFQIWHSPWCYLFASSSKTATMPRAWKLFVSFGIVNEFLVSCKQGACNFRWKVFFIPIKIFGIINVWE